MKQSSLVQMIVAAVLVVLGGLALAFGGQEKVRLEVEQEASDQVTVKLNDETYTVRLQELADGAEKSYSAGERTLKVKRVGDKLVVSLDGHELCSGDDEDTLVWVGEGEGKAEKVVVLDDGKGKVHKKIVVLKDGDGDLQDASAFQYRIFTDDDDDDATRVKVIALAGDDDIAIPFEKAHADRVRFRCAEDGTTLAIAKDKATQESYACPVCGRPMEKAAERKVKVMTVVTGEDDEEHAHGSPKHD